MIGLIRIAAPRPDHFRMSRKWLAVLVVFALLLVAARAYLPYYVHDYVQRTLNGIPDYRARIGDIDLHLWQGAYSIDDVKLEKISGAVPVPFFDCKRADLSIEWRALLDGALVGQIVLIRPRLNFVNGRTEAEQQTAVDSTWQDAVRELFPLRINRFDVKSGEVHYRDFAAEPQVDVYLQNVKATALNLTNSKEISKLSDIR